MNKLYLCENYTDNITAVPIKWKHDFLTSCNPFYSHKLDANEFERNPQIKLSLGCTSDVKTKVIRETFRDMKFQLETCFFLARLGDMIPRSRNFQTVTKHPYQHASSITKILYANCMAPGPLYTFTTLTQLHLKHFAGLVP